MRFPTLGLVPLGALLVASAAACSSSPSAPPPDGGVASPTYWRDVAPILQARCEGCHAPGGIAPFAFDGYEKTKALAGPIAQRTRARTMPPFNAIETSECKPPLPWKHDERLPEGEIATLESWLAAGTPEGSASDFVSRPVQRRALARVDRELAPAPFTAQGAQDQFRCFVLDPNLPLGAYVKGVHVLPGNAKVVHHVIVMADPQRTALAKAPVGQSWACGGAMPFDAGQYPIAVWTPGIDPVELPDDIRMGLTANPLLVMQIHYSPAGAAGEVDQTKVQLELDLAKPKYLLYTTAVGNLPTALPGGDGLFPGPNDGPLGPEFRIPANTKGHTETMQLSVGHPLLPNIPGSRIYGVMGHAHLGGTDVLVEHVKAGGTKSCLLQDRWDFHWQRMYAYDGAVERLPALEPGDRIRVRCTYDNSPSNTALAKERAARGLPMTDLLLGEETLDEMCLAIPQILIPHP
jgi:hypothetical protein